MYGIYNRHFSLVKDASEVILWILKFAHMLVFIRTTPLPLVLPVFWSTPVLSNGEKLHNSLPFLLKSPLPFLTSNCFSASTSLLIRSQLSPAAITYSSLMKISLLSPQKVVTFATDLFISIGSIQHACWLTAGQKLNLLWLGIFCFVTINLEAEVRVLARGAWCSDR